MKEGNAIRAESISATGKEEGVILGVIMERSV